MIIKALSEILMEQGAAESPQQARAMIKGGRVYINDCRVANTDGVLIIAEQVEMKVYSRNAKGVMKCILNSKT